MLLLAGNKAEILNSVRRTRFRQQALELCLLFRGDEVAGHQQAQRYRATSCAQLLVGYFHACYGVEQAFLAGAVRQIEHGNNVRIAARPPQFFAAEAFASQKSFSGGRAGAPPRQHQPREIMARVRDSVAHHFDVLRNQLFGISPVIAGEHDAQIHLLHEMISDRARTHLDHGLEPLGQAGRVPVQDDSFEERPAD